MKKWNVKRNELDIILTDLLPVEISRIFTVHHFYKYLLNKKSNLKTIEEDLKKSKLSTKLFTNWHATPLKYKVDKGNNDFREISLLNPLSLIQVYFFVKLYNDDLLNKLGQNNPFSLRYHHKNNDLFYKNSKKGLIEYEDDNKNDKITRALESSGIFYKIKPYANLGQFYNSDYWFELNSRYRYFAKIDYKECFGSIYTHTFKWIISNNTIDSRSFQNNHLYSVIDRLLQQINSSISNGIVVGPEFSRMLAEILLKQIDFEVYNDLVLLNKKKSISYDICRYVDDIYIFANDEETLNQIVSLYKKHSSSYQLKLNDLKSITGKLPHIWNDWKGEIKNYIDVFNERFFYKEQDNKSYLIKAKNFTKAYNIVPSMKLNFQNILSTYPGFKDKINSYVLSAIFKKVAKNKHETLFRDGVSDNEVEKVLDFIFYIYSFAPTFRNTQKLLSFIYVVKTEIGETQNNLILKKIIRKYAYIILNANLEDIVDLILLLGTSKIELPTLIEENLWERVRESNNPILLAIYLIYSQYNTKYFEQIKNSLQKIIAEKISIITNKENILLYNELWWVFIFYNCPFLDPQTQKILNEKLNLLNSTTRNPNPNDLCQNLIFDFLNGTVCKTKFIEWHLTNQDIMADITYATYERTIFRNKDSIFISDY
ncbi:RNA-directed DNA polymerase [Bacillus wiedmannii]|uniref:RNA-directed DNA polymerase n=1 Tax=Bacillus wiedmannii TaxID=1890302 RepID=UPI0021D019C3|nr:RNA-directed DNA polymerase [Bacillus wiedmannii]MCU5329695.1 RNA-directed DNA polymerase [Bacillus wiedmannii]